MKIFLLALTTHYGVKTARFTGGSCFQELQDGFMRYQKDTPAGEP